MPCLLLPMQKKEVMSQWPDMTSKNVTSWFPPPEETLRLAKETRTQLSKQRRRRAAAILCL